MHIAWLPHMEILDKKACFLFEVLHISIADAIGTDLFNYRDAESEWVNYFMSKGR